MIIGIYCNDVNAQNDYKSTFPFDSELISGAWGSLALTLAWTSHIGIWNGSPSREAYLPRANHRRFVRLNIGKVERVIHGVYGQNFSQFGQ